VSPANTAEPIEISFGMWTREGPRNNSDGEQGLGHAHTCPTVDIRKLNQQGQHQYSADANWGLLDGVTLVPPGKYD